MCKIAIAIAVSVILATFLVPTAPCDASVMHIIYIRDDPGEVFPEGAPNTLYIWAFMTDIPIAEIEFGLIGSYEIVALTPAPNWTNLGSTTSPHLVASPGFEIQTGPFAAIEVNDLNAPGSICFAESTLSSRLWFRGPFSDLWYCLEVSGWVTEGLPFCPGVSLGEGCVVEGDRLSWGSLKGAFRQ